MLEKIAALFMNLAVLTLAHLKKKKMVGGKCEI